MSYVVSCDPDARLFERLAYSVAATLPELTATRTSEAIQLSGQADLCPTLIFTPEALEVRLPTVDWVHGAYGPRPSTRLLRRYLLRKLLVQVQFEPELLSKHIVETFQDAKAQRLKEFHICRFCGKSVPHEHRHSRDVCHGCAEMHLGVIH